MPATRDNARALATPRARALRIVEALVVLGFAGFAVVLLALRYVVLPQVPAHREAIAGFLSRRIGAPIEIDALATGWDGWNPKLVIDGFRLRNPQGTQSLLELPHVELVASWISLPLLQLRLRELAIERPAIAAARDADGIVHVAGLDLDPRETGGESPFVAWLLRQREISVHDATFAWTDELRAAPTLTLEHVDLRLENELNHHRFGLRGTPPPELAAPLDVRGELTGGGSLDVQKAKGRVYLRLDYADVAAWRPFVPMPVALRSGRGALRVWVDFAHGEVTHAIADAELADIEAPLADDLLPLELAHVVGRVEWREEGARRSVNGRGVAFVTQGGAAQAPTDFTVDVDGAGSAPDVRGSATFSRVDLAPLAAVAQQVPLPQAWRTRLAGHAPHGALTGVRFAWQGPIDDPAHWSVHGAATDVGATAHDGWPGIAGLAGSFDGDDAQGAITFATRASNVDMPGQLRDDVRLDRLDGVVRWRRDAAALQVDFDDVSFANADLAGAFKGYWRALPRGPGEADLAVQFTRANAARMAAYLPAIYSTRLHDWVQRAFVKGDITRASLELRGDLADFPFDGAKAGTFTMDAQVHDATIDYAAGWPALEHVDALARLDRRHLRVEAARGAVLGADIGKTVADIGNLTDGVLTIDGTVGGNAPVFLDFLRQSPVGGWIDHVADAARASGDATLALKLVLPLHEIESTRVDGTLALAGASLDWPGAPPATGVDGKLAFDRRGIDGGQFTASALGGTAELRFARGANGLEVHGSGNGDFAALRNLYAVPLIDKVSGTSDWSFDATRGTYGLDWTLRSSLAGAAIDLPAPFAKSAPGALPLTLERRGLAADRDTLALTLGGNARVLMRRHTGGDSATMDSVLVLAGNVREEPADATRTGLWVRANLPRVDVDGWLALDLGAPAAKDATAKAVAAPVLAGVDIKAERMIAMRRRFRDIAVGARRDGNDWRFTLDGRDVQGTASWYVAAPGLPNGRAVLRLARLALPRESGATPGEPERAQGDARGAPNRWPEIDVEAQRFESRERDLGTLKVRAKPDGSDWLIEELTLANDGGRIDASGAWRVSGEHERTELAAHFDVRDADLFLARFGYGGEIRGAPTRIDGHFTWPGAPSDFAYEVLNGELELKAGAGQFLKIQPGLGKLLSVLSLQALPRRIALDFHDVFSEGFAFDEAKGNVSIVNGVLRTDALHINGTAARISIRGEADLARETQALDVHVQPSLSTALPAGAAALLLAANPIVAAVVGAGTLLAQKALQDPIEQIFAYEYRVTGSWSDPVATRVGREPVTPAAAASATPAPADTARATGPATPAPGGAAGAAPQPKPGAAPTPP
jgi:uncharacterized protein (TIGR02099 family)